MESTLGYLSLGMHQDAWDELEMLPPALRARDEVLEIRIEIYQKLEKWGSARVLAESLAKRNPENPNWWLSWAYALRREQTVDAAQEVLTEAFKSHPEVPLIAYNLACYASVLGRLDEATDLLTRAFAMDDSLRECALDDPDLEKIFGRFGPTPTFVPPSDVK